MVTTPCAKQGGAGKRGGREGEYAELRPQVDTAAKSTTCQRPGWNARAGRRSRIILALSGAIVLCTGAAFAKEGHFEKVKLELLKLYISCTTCHPSDSGEGLTKYGQRLAALGKDTPMTERLRRMERRASDVLAQTDPGAENDRIDVDGDGALNWVEILCGTDPSDPASVPPKTGDSGPTPRARVEAIVDCKLCHVSVATGGGREEAPHNAFGEAIAKMDGPRPAAGSRPTTGSRPDAPRSGGSRSGGGGSGRGAGAGSDDKPEPPDFLPRFQKVGLADTDRDKVKNWDEIATFHSPIDPKDTPTPAELEALKTRLLAITRHKDGLTPAHKP